MRNWWSIMTGELVGFTVSVTLHSSRTSVMLLNTLRYMPQHWSMCFRNVFLLVGKRQRHCQENVFAVRVPMTVCTDRQMSNLSSQMMLWDTCLSAKRENQIHRAVVVHFPMRRTAPRSILQQLLRSAYYTILVHVLCFWVATFQTNGYPSDVSIGSLVDLQAWRWPRGYSRTREQGLGLGFGLGTGGLGLGLGLHWKVSSKAQVT